MRSTSRRVDKRMKWQGGSNKSRLNLSLATPVQCNRSRRSSPGRGGEASAESRPHHAPPRRGIRAASQRFFVAAGLASSICSLAGASHAVAVTVEVASDVEELVDAQLARRLIRLELADVELPKVNGA